MKKIIEYTFEGKTELGIVGKATPLKDDLGNAKISKAVHKILNKNKKKGK